MININIIELKPKETNVLSINKKCEKCGYLHMHKELFRMENKYAVLHIMSGVCPHCDNWNEFSLTLNKDGKILAGKELVKYKIYKGGIL